MEPMPMKFTVRVPATDPFPQCVGQFLCFVCRQKGVSVCLCVQGEGGQCLSLCAGMQLTGEDPCDSLMYGG